MAVNWKTAIKPVTKTAAGGPKMSAAQRTAANMDKALAAFKNGNVDVKRATITKKGDNVHFSVRFANQALKLDGTNGEFAVPASTFESIFEAIKADVLKGAFDDQLAPLEKATLDRGQRMAAAKKAKK